MIHTLKHNPDFHRPGLPLGQELAEYKTTCNFPSEVGDLPEAPAKNHFLVVDPNRLPGEPEYLVTRLDCVLPLESRDRIYKSFKDFMATGPKAYGKTVREEVRSDTSKNVFFHVGTWSKFSPVMMLTGDTLKQTPKSISALANLLETLQRDAIPYLKKRLSPLIPTHFYNTEQYDFSFFLPTFCSL